MFDPKLIEKFTRLETPFYYYDLDLLRETFQHLGQVVAQKSYKIHYALKANSNERILRLVKEHGFGADCVSGNEILRALQVGFDPEDIVFAGVGKTDQEILLALEKGIHCFNCESLQELEVVSEHATATGTVAPVALRLNPDIDARTHHYITTGLEENKFGINLADLDNALARAEKLPGLNLIGLHFHIGSQICEPMWKCRP
ncbi:MAG: diaminopimelate decarboxylase, partial [Calditrichaeota bacterium]